MLLCLDIGNTHIFGGVYKEGVLQLQFRYPSSTPCTSDQLGVFFKMLLRENDLAAQQITKVAICSVVPSLNYSIRSAFLKYFSLDPFFLSIENLNGSISIAYHYPEEMGADRMSSVIAAVHKFPQQDIIIIDLGTATTFDVINHKKEYLGGAIIPGIYISMKALHENTAKLSPVNIVRPEQVIGQTTIANIQSGLYYSHLGAAKEIISRITQSEFGGKTPVILGTGGFSHLFEQEKIFTTIVPELVLDGLQLAALAN